MRLEACRKFPALAMMATVAMGLERQVPSSIRAGSLHGGREDQRAASAGQYGGKSITDKGKSSIQAAPKRQQQTSYLSVVALLLMKSSSLGFAGGLAGALLRSSSAPRRHSLISSQRFAGLQRSVPKMCGSVASDDSKDNIHVSSSEEGEPKALESSTGIDSLFFSIPQALKRIYRSARSNTKLGLLIIFFFQTLGTYSYTISTKIALSGGLTSYPLTIASLQLSVGVIYSLFLWMAPDARKFPSISFKDYRKSLTLGAANAGASVFTVLALTSGAVSFAQIVKAAEPAVAAIIGTLVYGSYISAKKWLTLIPIIGGVIMASVGEFDFAMSSLVTSTLCNVCVAVKGNEKDKLKKSPGFEHRIGSVGNNFAIATLNAWLFTVPLMLLTEGRKLGLFFEFLRANPAMLYNLLWSGFWYYYANETRLRFVDKAGAITQSVAGTASRVIIIITVALVLREAFGPTKILGAAVSLAGVTMYSMIDGIHVASKRKDTITAS